jgi:hypothetical protein
LGREQGKPWIFCDNCGLLASQKTDVVGARIGLEWCIDMIWAFARCNARARCDDDSSTFALSYSTVHHLPCSMTKSRHTPTQAKRVRRGSRRAVCGSALVMALAMDAQGHIHPLRRLRSTNLAFHTCTCHCINTTISIITLHGASWHHHHHHHHHHHQHLPSASLTHSLTHPLTTYTN